MVAPNPIQAMPPATKITVEEFDIYAEQPENADRALEFIAGEVYEKVPSNAYASKISMRIGYLIQKHLAEIGQFDDHVTGEAGGYKVYGWRLAPDVAYLSAAKQPELDRLGYNNLPPELAVEVDYPSTKESATMLGRKLWAYASAGTAVWIVYPETQTIEVYEPGRDSVILDINATLEGGDVLPGFNVPVKSIFPTVKQTQDAQ